MAATVWAGAYIAITGRPVHRMAAMIPWRWPLIGLLTFAVSGFYTHGRAYRGRYKALIVAQAVSLCFLIFGFLSFASGRLD